MKDIFPILVIGIVLSVVGIYVWFNHQYEKARTQKLRVFADSLGLSFYPEGDPNLVNVLAILPLFTQGRNKSIRNMVHGVTENVNLAIFDYGFVVGSGKHQRRVNQTVVYFDSQLLTLPDFTMRPETLVHRLGKILGRTDINFDSHPRFSSAFWLQGSNEEQLRQLFRAPVLEWFEGKRQISAEGCGTRLIVYQAAKRTSPEEMRAVMEQGFELYGLLNSPT